MSASMAANSTAEPHLRRPRYSKGHGWLETQIGDLSGVRRDCVDGQSRQVTTIPNQSCANSANAKFSSELIAVQSCHLIALWRFVEYQAADKHTVSAEKGTGIL
jgi:hypothetical protein